MKKKEKTIYGFKTNLPHLHSKKDLFQFIVIHKAGITFKLMLFFLLHLSHLSLIYRYICVHITLAHVCDFYKYHTTLYAYTGTHRSLIAFKTWRWTHLKWGVKGKKIKWSEGNGASIHIYLHILYERSCWVNPIFRKNAFGVVCYALHASINFR